MFFFSAFVNAQEPGQEKLFHPPLQRALDRCLELNDPSRNAIEQGDLSHEGSFDAIGRCLMDEFTGIVVDEMDDFIFFQGEEIYRHCTSGEGDARMDNFEDCMQPFHILIERVATPCLEAFGEETNASYACLNLFNEKMLKRVAQKSPPQQSSSGALFGMMVTALSIFILAWLMYAVFKKL